MEVFENNMLNQIEKPIVGAGLCAIPLAVTWNPRTAAPSRAGSYMESSDRCVRPRVSVRKWDLLMPMLRVPGGCIAFVPISPDVTKFPFGPWFGSTDASH